MPDDIWAYLAFRGMSVLAETRKTSKQKLVSALRADERKN